jgi:hypothetical protein
MAASLGSRFKGKSIAESAYVNGEKLIVEFGDECLKPELATKAPRHQDTKKTCG